MLSFGILCIIYYLCIIIYTKKWDSTFSLFWLVFGILHIFLSVLIPQLPSRMVYVVYGLMGICWFAFLIVEILICAAFVSAPDNGLRYVIVLGAQVRGTRITDSLRRRLDKALAYAKMNPDVVLIVSGGQGRGEDIAEAEAMAEYLWAHGVAKDHVRMENRSRNTRENLVYSEEIIECKTAPIGLITNNFHMYRALRLGKELGYTKLQGMAASSNPVLFLNYMVREFFAILQVRILFRKRH